MPTRAGRYRITAEVTDSQGRTHDSVLHTWVRGSGQVTWAEPEDGALAITPERASYRVGDTARFLVRNPFPGALALITLERYGVIGRTEEN